MIVELLLFCSVLILGFIYLNNQRPERFPPGPWGLPLVGYNPFLGKHPYKTFIKLGKKYGGVFSVPLGTKKVVILNDAKAIRAAWKDPVFNGRPKSDMDTVWGGDGTDFVHGIIFSEGPYWMEQRRFTLRNLRDLGFGKQGMETIIQNEIQILCQTLDGKAGQSVNMYHFFDLAVINGLWTIVTSNRFDQGDEKLKNLIENIMHTFMGDPITGLRYNCDILMKWFPNLMGWPGIVKSVGKILSYSSDIIKEHKDNFIEGSPRDFTDIFLEEMKRTTDPNSSFYGETGDRSLKITLLDLFLGGSETTGTTLMWFVLLMATHPEKQRKLQEEVDHVAGTDERSPPGLHLKKEMRYTEAVINEVLRYSAFAVTGVIHCTTEDIEFMGYHIPKRTSVISNLYCALHDPKYWDNPEEFTPERFMGEVDQAKTNPAFIMFGYGKRVCLGEVLARAQLFLFCTALMQRFTFSVIPDDPPSLEVSGVGVVSYLHPFSLMVTRRHQ